MSTGNVTVNTTILVDGGVFDGGCQTFTGGPGLYGGETNPPVFRLQNGATLKNVVIGGGSFGDGVHVYGGGTVENVHWLDVLEDALTIKSSGTVNVSGITAASSSDKIFQINAISTLNVSNCVIDDVFNTVVRQNGGTTFPINVALDKCRISNAARVLRADSPNSNAKLTNSQLHNVQYICFGTWRSCTESGNTQY